MITKEQAERLITLIDTMIDVKNRFSNGNRGIRYLVA